MARPPYPPTKPVGTPPPMGPGSTMPNGGAGMAPMGANGGLGNNPMALPGAGAGPMPPPMDPSMAMAGGGPMPGPMPGMPGMPPDPSQGMPPDPSMMGPDQANLPPGMGGSGGFDASLTPFPIDVGPPPPRTPEPIPKEFWDDEFFLKVKKWFQRDVEVRDRWAKDAEEDYKFYAGDQWTTEDKAMLLEQGRPVAQFNRIQPTIQVVSGSEMSNRQEIHFYPRNIGKAAASDLMTGAGKWFRDVSNAEDEESDAFVDLLLGGMGWGETRLDFVEDVAGKPRTDRVSPFEMVWDCNATKPNLADAKRIFRVKEVTLEEAKALAPDYDQEEDDCFDAGWAKSMMEIGLAGATLDRDAARLYKDQGKSPNTADEQDMVTIVEFQWEARVPGWMLPVQDGPNQVITAQAYKQMGKPKGAIRQDRLVRFKAIVGKEILDITETPCPECFSYQCMTGLRDQVNNSWMGLVRAMKDPQRWANKFWSQTLHIINTQAKGGIITERGVFEDDRKAEDDWPKPNAIVYTRPGMLTQNKIQPRNQMQFPTGIWEMMQFSVESIRDTTGINQEMLGLRGANQPGVLEYQRKQAGMTIIQGFFNAMRRYRKTVGRAMLWFIQNDLSDGRLVRISEAGSEKYIPLIRDHTFGEYDLVIDEASSSPDIKEKVWNMVQPMFMQLPPQVQSEIIPYSPLPASLGAKIQQAMQQLLAQGPPPDPAMMKAQAEIQAMQMKSQAEIQLAQQKAQADNDLQQAKLQAELQQAQLQQQVAQTKLAAEAQIAQAKLQHELQLNEQRMLHEQRMAEQRLRSEHQSNMAQVGVSALQAVQPNGATTPNDTANSEAGL